MVGDSKQTTAKVMQGDCLKILRAMPTNWVDLVVCSPPYEDCRDYNLGFNLKGEDWVRWAYERFMECARVCRGLVLWVVDGKVRNFRYSCTPQLLVADLHRVGKLSMRRPHIYLRYGMPGKTSELRNLYENIVAASAAGKLPWTDPTAMGTAPKYKAGGNFSNRSKSGRRANRVYHPPKRTIAGNVINCGAAGGGNIGSKLAHENEAPFPEHLAEYLIRTYCRPGGIVLDPFCGSGTTLAVADRWGRNSIGIDIRAEMVDLTNRRLAEQRGKAC